MEQGIALYEGLTLIFGIAAGVFLIASIALYFMFDMKSVISKRLGLTEKQALKRMQADAEAAEKATKKRVRRVREMMSGTETVRDRAEEKQSETAATKRPDNILTAVEAERENERLMQEAMAAAVSKNAGYAGGAAESETTQLTSDFAAVQPDTDSETTQLTSDFVAVQPDTDSETTQLTSDFAAVQPDTDSETTQLTSDFVAVQSDMDAETAQLGIDSGTAQLHASEDEEWEASPDTVVLHEETQTGVLSSNTAIHANKQFMLIRHIMLIHTDEVIA